MDRPSAAARRRETELEILLRDCEALYRERPGATRMVHELIADLLSEGKARAR